MSQGKLSSRGRVIRVIRGESSQKHAMINVLNVFLRGTRQQKRSVYKNLKLHKQTTHKRVVNLHQRARQFMLFISFLHLLNSLNAH